MVHAGNVQQAIVTITLETSHTPEPYACCQRGMSYLKIKIKFQKLHILPKQVMLQYVHRVAESHTL